MSGRSPGGRPRATLTVAVIAETTDWPAAAAALARRAVRAALRGRLDGPGAVTVLLSDDARLRGLNRDWRGKDKPTNVLSFPDGDRDETGRRQLGDIALALQTLRREAAAQGKTVDDHLTHLAVHGALHLVGYDHINDDDATIMESTERDILARLGLADPYAQAVPARRR